EQFSTLTGRLQYWELAWERLVQAPLTGYGFGVGARVALADLGRDTTAAVHNGMLETALGVGLPAFALWMIVVLRVFWGAAKHLLSKRQVPLNSIAVPLAIATILSSGVGGWMSAEMGLLMIILVTQDVQGLQQQSRLGRRRAV